MNIKALWMLKTVAFAGGLATVMMVARQSSAQRLVAFDLPAPRLAGSPSGWLNSGGKALEFEPGTVYVVEFWTYG